MRDHSQGLVAELRRRIWLSELIGRRVKLVRRGREFVGLCPFHSEKTPSFYVVDAKRFFHCFGCGVHGDAIAFVMQAENLGYAEAVEKLAAEARLAGAKATAAPRASSDPRPRPAAVAEPAPSWVPILPIPSGAPALMRPDGRTVELINPKQAGTRKERTSYRPAAWWLYRDAEGRVIGYVLRMEFPKPDGQRGKWTPQINFCAGRDGTRRWCIMPFPSPRPLYGLDELAARPDAPVLAVEGEKACDAGRRLLPGYVVVTWPGGSKGIAHVDWAPLAGRDALLLPDADKPGRAAVDGWINQAGEPVPGIAELLAPIARRVRVVDPPADLQKGWDLADAEAAGWSPTDAQRWLLEHLRPAAVVPAALTTEIPSSAPARAGAAPLDRRRLAGMVRKIISADEIRRKGTLAWAAALVSNAVRSGDIAPEIAEALLVRAAARAGLAETEARCAIARGMGRRATS